MKTLYIQIRDEICEQIIEVGLNRTESKLFFYFMQLDRFGDRPVKINVPEMLLKLGISKTRYYTAIAKFQKLGWFDIQVKDVKISNLCGPTNSRKQEIDSRKQEIDSRKQEIDSRKQEIDSRKQEIETPEPIKMNTYEVPQTNSDLSDRYKTHSDYREFLNTLGQERENFERFCREKINKCSFKIENRSAWLNKYFSEYWIEFKEQHPQREYKPPIMRDLADLYRCYRNNLLEPALYYGYSEEEVQLFLKQKSS